MNSITNILNKLNESRLQEAASYKGYTLKWEADDSQAEPHIIIYKGKEKVASAADDEEAKSIIDNELNESTEEEAYQKFLADMRANPTYKKMEALCSKYNYKLYSAYREKYKDGGAEFTSISIRETQRYQPEIYFSDSSFGRKEHVFRIQTTAYGALSLEEHAKFLANVTEAHELVTELSKLDLSTLYVVEREIK